MGKALIGLVLLAAGCATIPAPVENPRAIWCERNSPRRPSSAVVAAMTRAELDEVNAHNMTGELWCGWKP